MIAAPVWTWEVPVYLFAGGLAGASAGLAFASEVAGRDVLARRAWAVAGAAVTACPPLLVSDLGRPERFLKMMRVVKVTSPMSVGSWLLAAAGSATGVAAASRLLPLPAPLARLGDPAAPAAAVLGMPLATYTGVLIANTAVPVWHEARRELPFLFAAGAGASAGAAAAALTPAADAGPARRLAVGAALAELAIDRAMRRRLGALAEVYDGGRAPPSAGAATGSTDGTSGSSARAWHRSGRALLAGGTLALAASGGGLRSTRAASGAGLRRTRARSGFQRGRLQPPASAGQRPLAVAGGALTLAGALATRFAVFRAGFASASDPAHTVGPQRERTGAAPRA